MGTRSQRYRHGGFTLAELLVTMAVLAILATLAIPGFDHLIRRHRVSMAVNQLKADLAYARSDAVTRNFTVSICASSDGQLCSSDSGSWWDDTGSTNYATGWLVYGNSGYSLTPRRYIPGKAWLLRTAGAQSGVAVTAIDATFPTFGKQGEIVRDPTLPPFSFIVCSRAGATGGAENIPAVPGVQIEITGSGSAVTQTLAPGASCS